MGEASLTTELDSTDFRLGGFALAKATFKDKKKRVPLETVRAVLLQKIVFLSLESDTKIDHVVTVPLMLDNMGKLDPKKTDKVEGVIDFLDYVNINTNPFFEKFYGDYYS